MPVAGGGGRLLFPASSSAMQQGRKERRNYLFNGFFTGRNKQPPCRAPDKSSNAAAMEHSERHRSSRGHAGTRPEGGRGWGWHTEPQGQLGTGTSAGLSCPQHPCCRLAEELGAPRPLLGPGHSSC